MEGSFPPLRRAAYLRSRRATRPRRQPVRQTSAPVRWAANGPLRPTHDTPYLATWAIAQTLRADIPEQGVLDELYAKAMAIEHANGQRALLLTADLFFSVVMASPLQNS